MKKTPLIPRTLKENLIGLSYKDFLKQRKISSLAQRARKLFEMEEGEIEFEDKLQYLTQTVSDLTTKKNEIQELWNLSFKILKDEIEIKSIVNTTFYPLISLTGEASFSYGEKDEIMTLLDNFIKEKFQIRFEHEDKFVYNVNELFIWYQQKIELQKYLELGLSLAELSYLKGLYNNYLSQFESLKSISPQTYINFIRIIKYVYRNSDNSIKFIEFYENMCLQQIIVAKNSGNYYNYKQLLEDYYSVKLPKHTNWLYKNIAGYGEEPSRLIILFFLINIGFTFLFTFTSLDFNMSAKPSLTLFERFIDFLSFNTTTMMTVGYGDIYPIGIGARFCVIVLQLLGFATSGSAIALYIKKLFRY